MRLPNHIFINILEYACDYTKYDLELYREKIKSIFSISRTTTSTYYLNNSNSLDLDDYGNIVNNSYKVIWIINEIDDKTPISIKLLRKDITHIEYLNRYNDS